MKKIAFFGGSFNPPTNVHLEIAKNVISNFNIDNFFFVPVGNYYVKEGLIDVKHRYNMLKLICVEEEKMSVLDITLKEKRKMSAIDIFKKIENLYKNKKIYENEKIEFYYIMGADNFYNILKWKNYESLIKNYKLVIIKRDNIDINKFIEEHEVLLKNKNNFVIMNFSNDMWKINSTEVRNKILNKESVKKYLNSNIISYIKENNLYK